MTPQKTNKQKTPRQNKAKQNSLGYFVPQKKCKKKKKPQLLIDENFSLS